MFFRTAGDVGPYKFDVILFYRQRTVCGDNDRFEGSLREVAPRSGGGDCENSGSDLFTVEPSNISVHAFSLSRLRDSSLRREPWGKFQPCQKERRQMRGGYLSKAFPFGEHVASDCRVFFENVEWLDGAFSGSRDG